ncbi:MAG: hypothetical protein FJX59_08075 [Alphaproteobacteria bacterium]|nr:hypothetical protein [Alphaproteobacteria bacterium]
MMSARQLASALYGVWLLLRWDAGGFNYIDRTFGGFWRSYLVAIALGPVYFAHSIVAFQPSKTGPAFGLYMATESIAYVMSWTVFPFVMITVARSLDRDSRYFEYMVAYNWFQLAVGLVALPITILTDMQLIVPESGAFLNLVVLAAFFAYGTFIARTALDITAVTAVGVVFLDFILSLIVRQVVTLAS